MKLPPQDEIRYATLTDSLRLVGCFPAAEEALNELEEENSWPTAEEVLARRGNYFFDRLSSRQPPVTPDVGASVDASERRLLDAACVLSLLFGMSLEHSPSEAGGMKRSDSMLTTGQGGAGQGVTKSLRYASVRGFTSLQQAN